MSRTKPTITAKQAATEAYKNRIRQSNDAMQRAIKFGFAEDRLKDLAFAVRQEDETLLAFLGRSDLPERLPRQAAMIVFEVTGIDPRERRAEMVKAQRGEQGRLEI